MAGADVLGGGGEGGGEGIRLAEGAAEECVDEAACTAGEGDGFVDYGVCGDAEVKELVEAEAEDLASLGVQLAIAETGDEEVERGEVAEDAVEAFGDEATVAWFEGGVVECVMEEFVRERTFLFPREEEF